MNDIEKYRAMFDREGEAWVREKLAFSMLQPMMADVARHWLAERDAIKADAQLASQRKQQRYSNGIATTALVVAVAALAVSLYSILSS